METDSNEGPQPGESYPALIAGKKNKGGRPKGSVTTRGAVSERRIAQVVELAVKNVPEAAIARQLQISRSRVNKITKKFSPIFTELQNVEDYRAVKSQLLEAAELRALKSLVDEDKHSKASLNNVAYTLTQLHQAGRLERGQSTSNQSVQHNFIGPQTGSSGKYKR